VPLVAGDRVASSQVIEVESFKAIDRERLLGNLDDAQTATKRKELTDLLAMLDLAPVDSTVIDRAKSSFAVNVRALDAIHVATAEVWPPRPRASRWNSGRTKSARQSLPSHAGSPCEGARSHPLRRRRSRLQRVVDSERHARALRLEGRGPRAVEPTPPADSCT